MKRDPPSPLPAPSLEKLQRSINLFAQARHLTKVSGAVTEVLPTHLRVMGLSKFVRLGDCVQIETEKSYSLAQVVRIDANGAIVKSFESNVGAGLNATVSRVGPVEIAPHGSWMGRVLNAFARPVDDKGPIVLGNRLYSVDSPPPRAMQRDRVVKPAHTGVRLIDAFTPICEGQRIGVFAGSGVGKSTLLSMMTRSDGFSVAVVCLVGERGREVRDFLDMMTSVRSRSTVVVVATGDESPMMRRLAPLTAMSIAEAFRDQGASTILIVDSITRYAHASREVALAAGEPPVANGYTPSVFADLPKLLERAGPGETGKGAITGIFSVLVDGDNHNDPIADCIRGTLDGHIVLEREIAEQGRYPAINPLKSISRLADRVWSADEREYVRKLRAMLFRYEETRDFRMLGGYQAGNDPELDRAVAAAPLVYDVLRQSPSDATSVEALKEISRALGGAPVE
jgi:flagellum-specific ATP synthase